jgi:hypothetical protein
VKAQTPVPYFQDLERICPIETGIKKKYLKESGPQDDPIKTIHGEKLDILFASESEKMAAVPGAKDKIGDDKTGKVEN